MLAGPGRPALVFLRNDTVRRNALIEALAHGTPYEETHGALRYRWNGVDCTAAQRTDHGDEPRSACALYVLNAHVAIGGLQESCVPGTRHGLMRVARTVVNRWPPGPVRRGSV
ncbi:hypothetical protein [Streptomyces sp. NPDC056987]|uniref:hypothetical protein n=1 Tax=Streptomyces sp. NPDC056987 TaxID=3345988 RepID=UPI00363B78DC